VENDHWTDETMRALFARVCNWGRWGKDDELGTLNLITPATRRAAAQLVSEGITVSLSRNFPTKPGPHNPYPAQHYMLIAGDECGCSNPDTSQDFIGIAFHGWASTHIDALCHVFVDAQMFNGVPASEVRSTGARRNTVMALRNGIVGRGVLLDMPRALGVKHIVPGRKIGVAELEAAEKAQGISVASGDILLIRNGRDVEVEDDNADAGLAALHPEVLPWLHARQVAALGSDAVHDCRAKPNNTLWPAPIHTIGIVAMGLHLLDNLYLEDVAQIALERRRWAFHLCIAPLRIEGGTGSPVNPIATF